MYYEILKKLVSFKGRASRREFNVFFFSVFFIGIFIGIIGGITQSRTIGDIFILSVAIPYLAISVRRLHDTGKSGWWCFIGFAPFGQFFLLYFLMIQEGDPLHNQYDIDQIDEGIITKEIITNGADLGLVNFIKKSRDAGKTDEEIKAILLKNNWTEANIELAMKSSAE